MPINFTAKGMKRPNQPVQFTPELQREFIRCSKDIFYFAENYYTVVEEKRGKHIIKLFNYQKEMLSNFVSNRFSCILSARQMGKCVQMDSIVEIKDENTGKIEEITIKCLLDMVEKKD